ncbi:short/branched chain specific acyl-CoA dehydrogenase, mitochondrial [Diorhabda carinulata]|uniref:short/branched chain specific acyl-CoA dehydrogenase, mitochondrial n=1 Tax=Diorhabda carinulata TaxID=1163345 RepID=UPI0025A261DF|nr:short/branched chain specific acyl-CoA dehydrogenase, mitochondrial [Diorhabda carinulata]
MNSITRQIARNVNKFSRRNASVTTVHRQQTQVEEANSVSSRLPLTHLSEDEIIMKETVSRLAQEQIAPYVREMENEGKIKDSVLKMCFDSGLMGIEINSDYGGAGCNFMTAIITVEELSKVDPAVAALVDIHNTLVNTVFNKWGNQEQKEKYLPRLATDTVASFALSEPSSGSDAFALKTTAKKDGSDYILNGSKMWISNSDVAGVFLIMANANPSAGYKGITCFIVERDTPGFSVAKPEKKLGISASGTCMLNLDNVRVPESAILGEFGKGYKIAASILNEGRIGIAAQMVGLAQGCLDHTIPYTLERQQFGKPIFNFQGMQYQIAEVATEIEGARLLTYNAARMVEAKVPFMKEAAMAKFYAADIAQKATIRCIDWMGGVGFTKDFIQEKYYRDVKIGSIYEGTANMQLSTIAKCIEKEYKK